MTTAFGEPDRLRIRLTQLDDPRDLGGRRRSSCCRRSSASRSASACGENDYTTETFRQMTGRPPRRVEEFLHEHRGEFA